MFESWETQLIGGVEGYVVETIAEVAAAVEFPLFMAMVLYVVIFGLLIVAGRISMPILELAVNGLKLGILYVVVAGSTYADTIAPLLSVTLPNELSQLFSQGGLSGGAFFDAMSYRALEAMEETWHGTGGYIGAAFLSGMVLIVGMLLAGFGFAMFIGYQLMLLVAVAIGGLCIALFLFEPTRRWFYGWISQVVNFLLSVSLMILVLSMMESLTSELSTPGDDISGPLYAIYFIGRCALTVFLLVVLSQILGEGAVVPMSGHTYPASAANC